MPKTLIVIPDTNVFIHCLTLESIPWRDLGDYSEVRIVLVNAVHDELDNLKQGGNDRRAQRAKRLRPILTEMVRTYSTTKEIRDTDPKIALEVAIVAHNPVERPSQLAARKPDDDVLYDALCYQKAHPNTNSVFLSNDTSCVMRARAMGMLAQLVPDNWLLPPENDSRNKELVGLRDEVKRLSIRYPQVAIWLRNGDGSALLDIDGKACDLDAGNIDTGIEVTLSEFPDLTSQEASDIVSFAQQVHTLARSFRTEPPRVGQLGFPNLAMLSTMGEWKPPSKEEIARYQNEEYPNWLRAIRAWASVLGEQLRIVRRGHPLLLALKNIGNVPAESLVVELQLTEGLQFTPPVRKNDGAPHAKESSAPLPPSPPAPPVGRYVNPLEFLGTMGRTYASQFAGGGYAKSLFETPFILDLPLLDPSRDPHGFYWKPLRPSMASSKWALSCESFRHEVDTHELIPTILGADNSHNQKEGVLKVQITADNLPKPLTRIVVLKVKREVADTAEIARQMIRDSAWNSEELQP